MGYIYVYDAHIYSSPSLNDPTDTAWGTGCMRGVFLGMELTVCSGGGARNQTVWGKVGSGRLRMFSEDSGVNPWAGCSSCNGIAIGSAEKLLIGKRPMIWGLLRQVPSYVTPARSGATMLLELVIKPSERVASRRQTWTRISTSLIGNCQISHDRLNSSRVGTWLTRDGDGGGQASSNGLSHRGVVPEVVHPHYTRGLITEKFP